MAKKVTMHNGRQNSKQQVYGSEHPDRNFELSHADHIDPVRSLDNKYWNCVEDVTYTGHDIDQHMTFTEVEQAYYNEHYQAMLEDRNQRAIKARHPERVCDMDALRKSHKTCPEEVLGYIGSKSNYVDPDTLWDIYMKQIEWEMEKYPNLHYLDIALNVDEQGAPHLHMRRVWQYTNENGILCVGEGRALKEMGIERPDPTKPEGRYNNPKQTYTADCRAHLQQLCIDHGIEIDIVPREHSEMGLSMEEYKAKQEIQKQELAIEETQRAQQILEALTQRMELTQQELIQKNELITELTEKNQKLTAEIARKDEQIKQEKIDFKKLRLANENLDERMTFNYASVSELLEVKKIPFDNDYVRISRTRLDWLTDKMAEIQNWQKRMFEEIKNTPQKALYELQQAEELKHNAQMTINKYENLIKNENIVIENKIQQYIQELKPDRITQELIKINPDIQHKIEIAKEKLQHDIHYRMHR